MAFQLFLKAAKKELPSDQKSYQEALAVKRAAGFHVACCFEQGLGIKQNSYFAALWFERTAKRGHPAAQFNYACYLQNGLGVIFDLIEAAKQYELAEKTVVEARYNLALLYEFNLIPNDKDSFERKSFALDLFQSAAKDGFEPAIKWLDMPHWISFIQEQDRLANLRTFSSTQQGSSIERVDALPLINSKAKEQGKVIGTLKNQETKKEIMEEKPKIIEKSNPAPKSSLSVVGCAVLHQYPKTQSNAHTTMKPTPPPPLLGKSQNPVRSKTEINERPLTAKAWPIAKLF